MLMQFDLHAKNKSSTIPKLGSVSHLFSGGA